MNTAAANDCNGKTASEQIERVLDHGNEVVGVTLGGATGGLALAGTIGMGVGAAVGLALSLAAIHQRTGVRRKPRR